MTVIASVATAIELYKSVNSLFGGQSSQGDQRLDLIVSDIANLRARQEDILDGLFANRQLELRGEALEVRQLANTALSSIREFEAGERSTPDAALRDISAAVAGLQDIDVTQEFLAVEVGGLVAVAYLDIANVASDRGFARRDIADEVEAIADYFDSVLSAVRGEVNRQRNIVENAFVDIRFSEMGREQFGSFVELFYRATLTINGNVVDRFDASYIGQISGADAAMQDEAERRFASDIDRFVFSTVPFPPVGDLAGSAETLRELSEGEDARARFDNADNTVTLGGGNDYADGRNGDDQIFGGAGNDALRGGDDNDSLFGQSGDDVLNGQAGNDLLAGGTGSNILRGGPGIDTASYRDAESGVRVSLIPVAEQLTLVSFDLLEDIEALEGSMFNDILTGDTRANTLTGLAGDDQIRAGRGADRLIGGPGRDTLFGEADADVFVIGPTDGQGGPTTLADLSFGEGDRMEFTGFGAVRSAGSVAELVAVATALGLGFAAGPGSGTTVLSSTGAALVALPTIGFDAVADALQADPVAQNDTARTDEDSAVTTVSVLANDTDPNPGDTLTVTGVDVSGTVGQVTDTGGGVFVYNPAGRFEALAANEAAIDRFFYTVSDGRGGTDQASVTIIINGRNDAPLGSDDGYSTFSGTGLSVSAAQGVLANDSDPESAVLRATLASAPENGTVTLRPDGSFDYTPNAGFAGTDSFTYRASDGSATAPVASTVAIDVGADLALDDRFLITVDALESFGPGWVRLGAQTEGTTLLDNDSGLGAISAVNGAALAPGAWFDAPGGGEFRVFASGVIDFRNQGDPVEPGAQTGFSYVATDGSVSDIAAVTVSVDQSRNPAVDDSATLSASTLSAQGTAYLRLGSARENSTLLENDAADEILFVNGRRIDEGAWFDGDAGGQFRVFSSGVFDFRNQGERIDAGDVTGFDYATLQDGVLDAATVTLMIDDIV